MFADENILTKPILSSKMEIKQFQKVLKTIKKNPQIGLEEFYEHYSALIYSTARCICRSKDKANEVVNDVLLKVWKQAKIIKSLENPRGWLYTITVNAAKDLLRGHYELPLEEYILVDDSAERELYDNDYFYWMIADLSEIEQQIMIYRFVAQCSFQEMADEWGKPLSTVTSQYYRGLQKVRKKLEKKSP